MKSVTPDRGKSPYSQDAAQTTSGSDGKKSYWPPKLTEFGKVSQLTQGGSASNNETTCSMTKSDMRIKTNICRIGTHPMGFGLYLFDYQPGHASIFGTKRQFGVMAQEVEKVMPAAVFHDEHGLKMVDYAALGTSPVRH